MSTSFEGGAVWKELTRAVKQSKRPAFVAVAYFGQGAACQLPLRKGSRLVVDASEAAVKAGQTCPAELLALQNKGVRVFSATGLHGKVFVVGTRAYVGSANVSRRSAGELIEAMVVTTNRKTVADAKQFVAGLCLHDLGPDALAERQKLYQAPKVAGGGRKKSAARKPGEMALPRVFIAQTILGTWPEWTEEAQARGQAAAKRRMSKPKLHTTAEISWRAKPAFKPGDIIVQVRKEADGRRMVYPPATVLHIEKWKRTAKSRVFVYMEAPIRRRVVLEKLAAKIGRGAKKRLMRGGKANQEFARTLLKGWNADGAR